MGTNFVKFFNNSSGNYVKNQVVPCVEWPLKSLRQEQTVRLVKFNCKYCHNNPIFRPGNILDTCLMSVDISYVKSPLKFHSILVNYKTSESG